MLLEVDYEPLPAVVDGRAAMRKGRAATARRAPGNVCFRFARGDEAAVRKAFEGAAHVVRLDLVNNRLIGAAIEPRAVLADGSAGKLTLYCATQVPHHIRRAVTEQLGLPQTAIRLIAPDVGGGFGYKGKHYPEETIVAWAARRLRRPVKWIAHPQRMLRLRLSGPRPSDPRRACARRGGTFPRAARRHRGQHRRLCLDLRRRHPERDLQRAAGRRVPHAGDRRAIDRRVHQHGADRCLSRRRPAGGLLCAGAARRRGGARARHRPRGDPAAQSRAGRGHALQDADRADLRLRQFSEGVFAARSRLPTTRASPSARPAASRANAEASRLRHGLLCGILRRRAVALCRGAWARASASSRRRIDPRAARRQRAGAARHPQSRPGPRHDLRADHRVAARRADGEHRDHRRRHRPGAVRLRHVRLALDRGRRLGARPRGDEDRRERQEDRRASAGGLGRRHRVRRWHVRRRRHRPARDAARGRARRASSRPAIPQTWSSACRTARSTIRRALPGATARMPARSRSIATPATSTSSATGASTTSAP